MDPGSPLVLTRWRAGRAQDVTLSLPVLGTFSDAIETIEAASDHPDLRRLNQAQETPPGLVAAFGPRTFIPFPPF